MRRYARERPFNGDEGSNRYRNHTMILRGRTRERQRTRGSIPIVEDGQPNDRLSRNRDHIPSVRATHRPYYHTRGHGTSVSHFRKSLGPRAGTTCDVPKRHFFDVDDFTPRKRRRTQSPPPITPKTYTHPAPSTSENYGHSFSRVPGSRSHTIVTDVVEAPPLESSAKRESPPIDIDILDCPPSPPLFDKLGLPEKTSGSYHVPMIDPCRKGADLYKERRKEWMDSISNAVRFVRGDGFPPLNIERCLIRSDGMSVDWSVPNEGTPNSNASSNGSGATMMPAPALHPSMASPPIRRLAPLLTAAPTRPVGPSNPDDVSLRSSSRSTARVLPKGIATDALPVKIFDVPDVLLGEDMKNDRNEWTTKRIIKLGNPDYKGVFTPVREKGPDGKWGVTGMELHIYDTKETNQLALPKENAVNPTNNTNHITEETFAPAGNRYHDTAIPNKQTTTSTHQGNTLSSVHESMPHHRSPSASASQPSVSLRNTNEQNRVRERNPAQQLAPPFCSSTTSAAKTVAPIHPSRRPLRAGEPVLQAPYISAPSRSHSPEPESEPVGGPLPETVLPQSSSQTPKQSNPTHSLPRIGFGSSFCSGSNAMESLSDIAGGFLRRFFGYLDSPEKERLSGGYSEKAVMSWQLNDLPSVGICPQVGYPQAQGHPITEIPRRFGRNQLGGVKVSRPVYGKAPIVMRLEFLSGLKLAPSPDCGPEYEYEALDLAIGGLVQVRCWGNLYKMIDGVSHIALRFERTFILEKNINGATKFEWPWTVLSDQMTFFHRPGILCQCLGGQKTPWGSTSRA